jgi:hypothetical protein
VELPDSPARWGFGDTAHLLLGVLPHSSRWRGWIAEAEDQPHLIEGLHQVSIGLGGLPQRWRFDRMATVCHPGSGRITASFGPVAMHYQVGISICPSRHAWRKGAMEKSAHHRATLVAHPSRRRHRRRGPSQPGPHLYQVRRPQTHS